MMIPIKTRTIFGLQVRFRLKASSTVRLRLGQRTERKVKIRVEQKQQLELD